MHIYIYIYIIYIYTYVILYSLKMLYTWFAPEWRFPIPAAPLLVPRELLCTNSEGQTW